MSAWRSLGSTSLRCLSRRSSGFVAKQQWGQGLAGVAGARTGRVMAFQAASSTSAAAAIKSDDEAEDDDEEEAASRGLFLILGKPGGGKGTICGKILADFSGFRHLSTGDILRHHVRAGTDLGLEARRYMDAGALVPDHVMIDLLLKEGVLATCSSSVSLLLDGFPRTLEQAVALEEEDIQINHVINLDVPTEVIVERISDRWIHAPSGRVYSYSYKPPKLHGKDDVTGEALVQREDDKPESVRERLIKYDKMTSPLVDFYEAKGILQTFRGTESDVIYPNIRKFLEDDVGIST